MAVIRASEQAVEVVQNGLGRYGVRVWGNVIWNIQRSGPWQTRWYWLACRKAEQERCRLHRNEMRGTWSPVQAVPNIPCTPPVPPPRHRVEPIGTTCHLVTDQCRYCGRKSEHLCSEVPK